MTDAMLLRTFVEKDDQEAFAQLVARYANLVYSVCRRQVRDHHLAQDICQTVFLLLARKSSALLERESVAPWLIRTAHYTCKDALKRRRPDQSFIFPSDLPAPVPEFTTWDHWAPYLDEAL